ncbi:MAG: capsule biosynthesis protein [Rhodobacter sp.]|nr:capsule biosynthesis protein [Rhodobacter sp.]
MTLTPGRITALKAPDPQPEAPAGPARSGQPGQRGQSGQGGQGGGPGGGKGGKGGKGKGKGKGRNLPARVEPAQDAEDDNSLPAKIDEAPKPAKIAPAVAPFAKPSSFRLRHLLVGLSFLVVVVVPAIIVAWYLWTRAADQYASTLSFSVRTEESASSVTSILGSLNLSGSSTSDTDILYDFIQSQDLVNRIDKKIDLRSIWAKADADIDPIYAFHRPGTIEDLLKHWGKMVKIIYDSRTGLIEIRALAFDPQDARTVAEAIYAESTALINDLSDIAREDAIGYARDELAQAVERLKTAREAVTRFRNRTQIVDPSMDLAGQAGLLNTLNQQLAEALIELDLLKQTTRDNDPRVAQAERKIQVIENRIAGEKRKLGIGDSSGGSEVFANLVGEFERLTVDREFAETSYTAALAAFDLAQAEARRQSRYLAAHVRPTLAERSQYPQRLTLFAVITLFAFLMWTVLVLVGYSLRDRR